MSCCRRIGKVAKVADLGDDGHRDDQRDAAHRLQGLDYRRHRPAWEQLLDLAGQPGDPSFRVLNRVNVILQHDLLAPDGQSAPSSASGDRRVSRRGFRGKSANAAAETLADAGAPGQQPVQPVAARPAFSHSGIQSSGHEQRLRRSSGRTSPANLAIGTDTYHGTDASSFGRAKRSSHAAA